MAAVAHRMVDTHKNIIGYRKHGAAEIIPEIADGLGHHIFRGAHPAKNHRAEGDTQDAQYHTGAQTEGHIRVNRLFHGIIVLCAVAASNQHTGTHGHTVEKADEHKNQAAGGADRRQGILAQKIAYTPGVKGIIELLEHMSQKDRKGKQQHFFPDHTLSQSVFIIQGGHFLFRSVAPATILLYSFCRRLSSRAV